MALTDLLQIPEPILAAGAVSRRLDNALARGFARITDETRDDLGSVARTFAGTPLGEALDAAAQGVDSGVQVQHLRALAEARVALDGARYDALMEQATAAVGFTLAPAPATTGGQPHADVPLLESVQHWLLELALAGFLQLERATVAPFVAVLESLQELPEHTRLSALLTGFTTELLDHTPTASLDSIPRKRWADLWSRSMLLASRAPQVAAEETVNTTFTPFGVDLRLHDNLASAQLWGAVDRGNGPQITRLTINSWKVDVVTGAEIWSILANRDGGFLGVLTEAKSATLKDAILTSAGDLIIEPSASKTLKNNKSVLGEAKAALSGAVVPRAVPLDRHPAQIAIPVYLEGCKLKNGSDGATIAVGDVTLPLALDHVGPLGPDEKAILKTGELVALLRFDGERWIVQPLTVEGKEGLAQELDKGLKLKGGSATILKDRASKLLRRKS